MASDETIRALFVAEGVASPHSGRDDGARRTVDVLVTLWTDGTCDVALRPGADTTFGPRTWGPRTTAEQRPA